MHFAMNPSFKLLLRWIPVLFFFILLTFVSSSPLKIPRLGVLPIIRNSGNYTRSLASVSNDIKTFFYTQTLDHFNYGRESYATFKQRYVIKSKYWGGASASAPIFVCLGDEASIDGDVGYFGFLDENAPHFKALLVYIEHRYYGKSNPFGSMEEAMKNDSSRSYFNSAQAIADYAEVIMYLKKKLSAQNSPVVVVGASYGGMLASWFRLKYPHIALGALASSAPILYFDDITPQNGYLSVVTKDFKEAGETCYKTIRSSWSEIDKVASKSDGLSILSQRFKTCKKLNESSELKNYLELMYTDAAQYNDPSGNTVNDICGAIDGAHEGTDSLGRIFAGVVARGGNKTCYDMSENLYADETDIGWGWQTCSEMVIPIGCGSNDTMFPAEPFNLKDFTEDCSRRYGVPPRPHWVTAYYGGHDLKRILKRFASNIIFSNGLKDPWSSGGVLEDISDSVVAVNSINGSHCLDVSWATVNDPHWLIMQRKEEVKIIKGWLKKYYADLRASEHH